MAIRWESSEDFEALVRQHADQAEAAERLVKADVEAGRFRFIFDESVHYDFANGTAEYWRLLKERLGVEGFVRYKIEAPNFDAARVFVAIYHRRMSEAIAARFGSGILRLLSEEAKESYESKRRDYEAAREAKIRGRQPFDIESMFRESERANQRKIEEGRACPKCGFSFAWNGSECGHCHFLK